MKWRANPALPLSVGKISMNDYTPKTHKVRLAYIDFRLPLPYEDVAAEFDRWLAQHDAEVRNSFARWLDGGLVIPGTPIFGCPWCGEPWETEKECEHVAPLALLIEYSLAAARGDGAE